MKETDTKTSYEFLYNKVGYEFLKKNLSPEYYDRYFLGKKFDNDFYLTVAIANLINNDIKTNCSFEKEFNRVEVLSKIKELFGNVEYEDRSLNNDNISITFDTSGYHVKANKCSGFDYKNGGIKEEYVKSTTIGDFLYLYTRALYVDLIENEDDLLVFNYHDGINKEDKIIANDISNVDMENVSTYKYIFKKVDGNYIFDSVIKVK